MKIVFENRLSSLIGQQQVQRSSSSSPSPSSPLSDIVTIQNTWMSVPTPSASANKQNVPHQIVVALPLRNDGKIWSGTVTFAA